MINFIGGAMAPADAEMKAGDRADNRCILAALRALQELGVDVTLEQVQTAIDAYFAAISKRP